MTAALLTVPILLVSTAFSWAIDDLSMGHVEDSSALLMVPIGIAAFALFVLVTVFLAPSAAEAQARSRPLVTVGTVSVLILLCLLSAVLTG